MALTHWIFFFFIIIPLRKTSPKLDLKQLCRLHPFIAMWKNAPVFVFIGSQIDTEMRGGGTSILGLKYTHDIWWDSTNIICEGDQIKVSLKSKFLIHKPSTFSRFCGRGAARIPTGFFQPILPPLYLLPIGKWSLFSLLHQTAQTTRRLLLLFGLDWKLRLSLGALFANFTPKPKPTLVSVNYKGMAKSQQPGTRWKTGFFFKNYLVYLN